MQSDAYSAAFPFIADLTLLQCPVIDFRYDSWPSADTHIKYKHQDCIAEVLVVERNDTQKNNANNTDFKEYQSFNPLKTKRNLPYIKNQFVPRSKHFSPRL